jgi:hypothetical protein
MGTCTCSASQTPWLCGPSRQCAPAASQHTTDSHCQTRPSSSATLCRAARVSPLPTSPERQREISAIGVIFPPPRPAGGPLEACGQPVHPGGRARHLLCRLLHHRLARVDDAHGAARVRERQDGERAAGLGSGAGRGGSGRGGGQQAGRAGSKRVGRRAGSKRVGRRAGSKRVGRRAGGHLRLGGGRGGVACG